MWVLAHLLIKSRVYYVLKYLYEHELVWVCGWWCLRGNIPGCNGCKLMVSENRKDLKGLNCIMPGGLWKHWMAHRCLLPCSNLFFNLLYWVIQPARLPDFPYLNSKLIWGNIFCISCFPVKISYFHVIEALTPISCLIDLKLIRESALSLRICMLPYSSTVVIYVSSLVLLLAQKSV